MRALSSASVSSGRARSSLSFSSVTCSISSGAALRKLRANPRNSPEQGEPLHYFAIGGRKIADVPPTFLEALDLSDA